MARATRFIAPRFFDCIEARLEIGGRLKPGEVAYRGVYVTRHNNEDMRNIWEMEWRCRAALGEPLVTYHKFRTVVGQYARFAITSKLCSANGFFRRGSLFKIMCCLKTVQSFIGYFQNRAAPGTVIQKAWHLSSLARCAILFFDTRKQPEEKGKVEDVREYLGSVTKANKSEARRVSSKKKSEEYRIESGLYLAEEDIHMFAKQSLLELNDIIEGTRGTHIEGGEDGVRSLLKKRKKLVTKWAINFLALLSLHGGGQRPQVYALLQVPTKSEMQSMRAQAIESDVFSISVTFEKRIRSMDMPNVLFPRVVYRALAFHVDFVLPVVYDLYNIGENDQRRKSLLVNTANGNALKSTQVTKGVQHVLKSFDPELGNINSMTLRASIASMMVQRHRRGEMMTHFSEERFLEYLAKVMNTSAEQLRETYVSCEGQTHKECAAMVRSIIDSSDGRAEPAVGSHNVDMDVF